MSDLIWGNELQREAYLDKGHEMLSRLLSMGCPEGMGAMAWIKQVEDMIRDESLPLPLLAAASLGLGHHIHRMKIEKGG